MGLLGCRGGGGAGNTNVDSPPRAIRCVYSELCACSAGQMRALSPEPQSKLRKVLASSEHNSSRHHVHPQLTASMKQQATQWPFPRLLTKAGRLCPDDRGKTACSSTRHQKHEWYGWLFRYWCSRLRVQLSTYFKFLTHTLILDQVFSVSALPTLGWDNAVLCVVGSGPGHHRPLTPRH